MGQVTIYLDAENERRMKQAAKTAGLPVSRWVADLVWEKTRGEWPAAVREAVGTWGEFPDAEELRRNLGEDTPRETL